MRETTYRVICDDCGRESLRYPGEALATSQLINEGWVLGATRAIVQHCQRFEARVDLCPECFRKTQEEKP